MLNNFSKGGFFFNDAALPNNPWFKISVKSDKPFGAMQILRPVYCNILPVHYCVSLIMINCMYAYKNAFFIPSISKWYIFQLENSYELSSDNTNSVSTHTHTHKSEAIGPGSFNTVLSIGILSYSTAFV